jgi:DNA-binding protein YbaB
MLQDIIVLAVNDALKKVDIETESKMGKFGPGLSGLM